MEASAKRNSASPAPKGPPSAEPVGRAIASSAKVLSRAFVLFLAGSALSGLAGSMLELILLALKQQDWPTQQDLAGAVGIEGPTLTHHLDGLDKAGLIERARDPKDRRAVRVELSEAGHKRFKRLAKAAIGFDQRLRAGLSDEELDEFRRVLGHLRANVASD
jgi:MarR family transcriptional regulator, transcriptional regulator for hemolysin